MIYISFPSDIDQLAGNGIEFLLKQGYEIIINLKQYHHFVFVQYK
jgi:hypothetical protein